MLCTDGAHLAASTAVRTTEVISSVARTFMASPPSQVQGRDVDQVVGSVGEGVFDVEDALDLSDRRDHASAARTTATGQRAWCRTP